MADLLGNDARRPPASTEGTPDQMAALAQGDSLNRSERNADERASLHPRAGTVPEGFDPAPDLSFRESLLTFISPADVVNVLLTFNVDCGEVLPGHRLITTGLRDDGLSNDSMNADYMHHYKGKSVHRVASLTYELVPGLDQPEHEGSVDVDVSVVLEPPPNPDEWGSVLTMGGERAMTLGGPSTEGAFGPFVLPEGTKRLTASLTRVTIFRPESRPVGDTTERPLGTLHVDVASGAAHWSPA